MDRIDISERVLLTDWMEARGWPAPYGARTPQSSAIASRWPPSLWMLWALALEVDEHRATRTGASVCRACGGRGEVIVRVFESLLRIGDGPIYYLTTVGRCTCGGPTRPHTVSMHRLVETLASWRSPIVSDWPDLWAVRRDAMEAAGWLDVLLPGDTEVTPAWVCQWWRAFGEWTATGRVVDVDALASELRSRVEHRLKISDARDAQARFILANPDALDSERCIAGLWLGHTEVVLVNASPWTMSVDMPALSEPATRRWTFPVTNRHAGLDTEPIMFATLHRPSDAERVAIGRYLETHAELRAGRSRAASARLAAIGTRADIETRVLALPGVEFVDIRETGAHQIEVHVWGGIRESVVAELRDAVPAGVLARAQHHACGDAERQAIMLVQDGRFDDGDRILAGLYLGLDTVEIGSEWGQVQRIEVMMPVPLVDSDETGSATASVIDSVSFEVQRRGDRVVAILPAAAAATWREAILGWLWQQMAF